MLKCPNSFDYLFGKKLIKYLNPLADISMINTDWCWKEFAKQFGYLKPKVMKYFEQAKEGDPSLAVFYLYKYGNFDKQWVKKFISNCKIGNPSWIAYCMSNYQCNKLIIAWAQKVIENCKIGEPAFAAYCMTRYCGSTKEWAEKVIENCKINNEIAYYMTIYCGSSEEWYYNIIKK